MHAKSPNRRLIILEMVFGVIGLAVIVVSLSLGQLIFVIVWTVWFVALGCILGLWAARKFLSKRNPRVE